MYLNIIKKTYNDITNIVNKQNKIAMNRDVTYTFYFEKNIIYTFKNIYISIIYIFKHW